MKNSEKPLKIDKAQTHMVPEKEGGVQRVTSAVMHAVCVISGKNEGGNDARVYVSGQKIRVILRKKLKVLISWSRKFNKNESMMTNI